MAVEPRLLLGDRDQVRKETELRLRCDGAEGSEKGCDILRSLFRLQLHNAIVMAAFIFLHLFGGAGVCQIKLRATCIHKEYLNLVSLVPALVE